MASFTERIRLIFDVDSKGAQNGFSGLVSSIKKAETASGKLKAALHFVNQQAGLVATGAGVALIRWASAGADKMEALAKTSKDVATATGLTVEQASRWIAVADDSQVSAEQLEGALLKVTKSLDDKKWAKYGIETRTATGYVRTTNEVLLDVFDSLAKAGSEQERARMGAELFGKSWSVVGQMVGGTREEFEKMLAAVSAGQVITDSELARTEELRLAKDRLNDALTNLQMGLGGIVTAAAPAIEGLAKLTEVATDGYAGLSGADAESIAGPLQEYSRAAEAAGTQTAEIADDFDNLNVSVWNALSTVDRLRHKGDEWWRTKRTFGEITKVDPSAAAQTLALFEIWVSGAERGKSAMVDLANEYGLTRERLDELKQSYIESGGAAEEATRQAQLEASARKEAADAARDELDAKNALINSQLGLSGAVRNYQDALDDLATATDDATTSKDEYAEAVDRTASAAVAASLEYVAEKEALAELNGETYTAKQRTDDQVASLEYVAATLAPDSPLRKQLEAYIAILKGIPSNVTTVASVVTSGAGRGRGAGAWGPVQGFAGGTSSAPAGPAWVGENGPELINMRGGESVIPAPQSAALAAGGNTYTINVSALVPTADIGRIVVDAINAHTRNGGQGPR